jgi:molybdenum cofactor cytidylyltransferase
LPGTAEQGPGRAEKGTHAIVLAAGAARRFGGGKLCAPFRGKPLVAWAVEAALRTIVESVIVVVGADADRVARALESLPQERLRTVTCTDWEEGLSRSLVCGLDSVPLETTAVLVFLGDMPLVSSTLADRLVAEVLNGAPAALPVHDGGPAHPVAIASRLFPDLRRLSGDQGARAYLRTVPLTVSVETGDSGSTFDVDSRGDLEE